MKRFATIFLFLTLSYSVFANVETITRGNDENRDLKTTQIYQDDDGSTGASLELINDSESEADNDTIGSVKFIGLDSADNETVYGEIDVESEDVTSTTEDGSIVLSTMQAGTLTTALTLDTSAVFASTVDAPKVLTEKVVLDTVQTFVDEDATPDVSNYSYFKTNTTAVTITDFDGTGIEDGQLIYVISKGAITFDVTSSGIVGGTTDIVTAAGDVTVFLYDGTDWYVISRMDLSDDLN